ncbi:hypothetical protein U9M48_011052 [Paspalum notatum var. saurae]|uniref:ELM2 domain-containing protein n=1 Tax=Paspalum notatum var. saurae TaxID=547442 RepID=A0AAQ3SUV2_PASNO
MDGSDVPPGGSGAPPGSPEQHKKRKSGAAAADKGASSASGSSGRVTRSMASGRADESPEQPRKRKSGAGAADEGDASGSGSATHDERRTSALVDSAMAWTRRAAEGELWEVRGRNRGIEDEDQLTAVMLGLRFRRFENVDPDHPDTPYPKKQKRLLKQGTRSSERIASVRIQPPNFLASRGTSVRPKARVDPVAYQAAVPEWVNAPSEEDLADYKNDNETSQKMGMRIRLRPHRIVESPKTRNTVDDRCKCRDPGSEACVRLHVKQAWKTVQNELGKGGFKSCGFDAMGERVLNAWTAEDKNILADIEKLVPHNNHEDFMKIALKQFSSERTADLSRYYYNVFLPRRLASLNRAEDANATDVDNNQDDGKNVQRSEEKRRGSKDDEGNSQDDDKNVRHSEEKTKGSGSSSKRLLMYV